MRSSAGRLGKITMSFPFTRHWYVCLTNSRKMRFPLFRTTALPSRRPTTIPTRGFPRPERQETTLKNRVVVRFPSRLTRSKSSVFFKNTGGHREETSLIGYGQAVAAFSATAGKYSSPAFRTHALAKPVVSFSLEIRRLSIRHGHGRKPLSSKNLKNDCKFQCFACQIRFYERGLMAQKSFRPWVGAHYNETELLLLQLLKEPHGDSRH